MTSLFPIQKSILSRKGIEERILPLYSIEPDCTCRFISHGCNDTYKISGENNYYLRIYRLSWRGKKNDILAEAKLLNFLGKNSDISITAPIKKLDGEFLSEVNAPEGTRYVALFKSAIGESKKLNAKRSSEYGKMVAKIHLEADKINEKLDRFHIDLEHLLHKSLEHAKPFFAKRKEDYTYLESIAEKLGNEINKRLSKDPSIYGICHGDLHSENVFFDKDDNPSIFDFDCFGYGWRSYDIASFLRSLADEQSDYWKKETKIKVDSLWDSFLTGYSETRKLTKEELEAIYIFVPIRKIWALGFCAQKCDDVDCPWFDDNYIDKTITFIKKWIEHYKVLG